MSRFSLQNHVALVTGSTAGLGKGTARGLARAGARVAINYQNDTSRRTNAARIS